MDPYLTIIKAEDIFILVDFVAMILLLRILKLTQTKRLFLMCLIL